MQYFIRVLVDPFYKFVFYRQKNVCTYNTSMVEATVSNFGYVQSQNATAMQLALQEYGPLAVAMTVINSFYSYAYNNETHLRNNILY